MEAQKFWWVVQVSMGITSIFHKKTEEDDLIVIWNSYINFCMSKCFKKHTPKGLHRGEWTLA